MVSGVVAPLVVVVGPTASGKSALAMKLAMKFAGEIICADSRTVYRHMDIGTAKPDKTDQKAVKHHVLDVVEPNESFTAAEFKRLALASISEIADRDKLPIMAGGTGLYIDGVIFDYAFLPPVASEEREHLQQMSVDELQKMIQASGLNLPRNSRNPRHLIRVIETNGAVAVKKGLRANTLVIGIDAGKDIIRQRIADRVDKMVKNGFVEEAKMLSAKYGWSAPGLRAPGYKAFRDYLEGSISLGEAKQKFITNDYQLAKRQRTWFKRNPRIIWTKNSVEAEALVNKFLQSQRKKSVKLPL